MFKIASNEVMVSCSWWWEKAFLLIFQCKMWISWNFRMFQLPALNMVVIKNRRLQSFVSGVRLGFCHESNDQPNSETNFNDNRVDLLTISLTFNHCQQQCHWDNNNQRHLSRKQGLCLWDPAFFYWSIGVLECWSNGPSFLKSMGGRSRLSRV